MSPPPLVLDMTSVHISTSPKSAPPPRSSSRLRTLKPRPKTSLVRERRPLPPVPAKSPTSAPPARTLRPLPSIPSFPRTPLNTIDMPESAPAATRTLTISLTPSSPLPNSESTPEPPASAPLLVSPRQSRPKPLLRTQTLPELHTVPDLNFLAPPDEQFDSPITPTVPRPPSPRTARRRRGSKLRRLLGESVPFAVDPIFPEDPQMLKYKLLAEIACAEKTMATTDSINVNVIAFGGIDDGSEDGSEDWEDDTEDELVVPSFNKCSIPLQRFSTRVYAEKGSRREHKDFSAVLHDLRNL